MKIIASFLVLLAPMLLMAANPAMPPQEAAPFKIVVEPDPSVTVDVKPKPVLESDIPVVDDDKEPTVEPDPVPNCGHLLQAPKGYDDEVLMLQIYLDRRNFSTGVIDGVWGVGSREAMRAWQASQGLRTTQWVDVPLYAEIATMTEALTRYTVTEADAGLVTGVMPSTWAERSRLPLMGYRSLSECIAERFHTSERTLRRLNPAISDWEEGLTVGTVLTVPNVRQAALEKPAKIAISLEECLLVGLNAQNVPCLRFPCSIARRRAHLPSAGEVTVKNMAPAPNYTYDPSNYGQDASVGKMVVPAGPRNPVGSRWIGLSLPGYGIHGTPHPNTVGRPESRGCFRLTNWNAEKLFELVSTGTPVQIVRSLDDLKKRLEQEAQAREDAAAKAATKKLSDEHMASENRVHANHPATLAPNANTEAEKEPEASPAALKPQPLLPVKKTEPTEESQVPHA